MAKRIITTEEFTDDLDGGKAEGTVRFAFDGSQYEIDLSKKNRVALEKSLKPYVEAARRVKASHGPRRASANGRRSSAGSKRTDLSDIRQWAQQNGFTVSSRGRIPASVIEAFDAR